MNYSIVLSLLLLTGTCAFSQTPIAQNKTATPAPAIETMPSVGMGLKLQIIGLSLDGKLRVSISNSPQKPIRVWRESNSWGAMNWRVFVIRKGEVEAFFESPIQMFTKNNPTFDEIASNSRLVRELDLNGGNWCGRGQCSWWNERGLGGEQVKLEQEDTVIVTYDVRPTNESKQMNVWIGVTAGVTTAH